MSMPLFCRASYRKENHKLSFALMKACAAVKYAYCTCKAGKGGWCNHMYALMKVIAKFSLKELKYIPELLPCTSAEAMWLDSTMQTFCKCFQTNGHCSSQSKA